MIESVNGIRRPVSSYTIWLMSSVWRRKTPIAAVIVMTVLLVLCLQYNVTKEIVEMTLSRQQSLDDEAERSKAAAMPERGRLRSVQFVSDEASAGVPNAAGGQSDAIDYQRSLEQRHLGEHSRDTDVYRRPDAMEAPYVPKQRIVHLDLKGAPPKVEYLRRLFPMFKELGATGILLEWEDMFPWSNKLAHLAAGNAFTRQEAKEILKAAHKNRLDVIPAIQTFGHVEFALKNADFAHLREVPESPQALCPSLNASLELVQDMVDQVMRLHGDASFLHIGCDEVFHLGECSRCRKKQREDLFLTHVSAVARYVRTKHNVVPIIWDDMLRQLPSTSLDAYKIGELVEPMVWVYAEDVYHFVPQSVWEKYGTIFPQIWTASAFKGAFGETFYVPNAKRHLDNNMNWLALMSAEEFRFKNGFRGIAITGWQRYDHFATLCEILPSAIPSLAVSLAAVSHGYANSSLREQLDLTLSCGIVNSLGSYVRSDADARVSFLDLDENPFLWDQFSRCAFPGSQFFRMLYRWHTLEREVNEYLTTAKTKKAWMTDYNIRRNYSIPFRVDELMSEESRLYHNVLSMVQSVQESLSDIYDKYTIAEWIEQKLYPTVLQLERLQTASQQLKARHSWPRRPLPPLSDLLRIGVTVLANSSGSTVI